MKKPVRNVLAGATLVGLALASLTVPRLAAQAPGEIQPAVDAAFKKFESELDPVKAKAYAGEFQKIIAEDIPTIPLTSNTAAIAKPKGLKNFKPNPTNMTNFVDTAAWYMEG